MQAAAAWQARPWGARPSRRARCPAHRTPAAAAAQSAEPAAAGAEGAGEEAKPLRVSLVSLGCPKNTVDGESAAGRSRAPSFVCRSTHKAARL